MVRHYLKIAFRNLFRNKAFSIINISGLGIGMASAVLILLWIQNEISYDRFHANTDRLYKVYSNTNVGNVVQTVASTPELMAPVLKDDVPEIEEASRFSSMQYHVLAVGENAVRPKGGIADNSFLSIFSFPLMHGNRSTALKDPFSVVLTEQLARNLFGKQDAMGKLVRFDQEENLKVTGILRNLPNNTSFNFEYLISYEHKKATSRIDSNWTNLRTNAFALLKPNTSIEAANNKIKNIAGLHSPGKTTITQFLYPVSKLRLYANFENGREAGGRIEMIRILISIASFILLIACINFTNLSTARSEKRTKEVGVRKVVGAQKKSLVLQFLAESILMSFISSVLALLIVQLCLPAFNGLVQKELFIDYSSAKFWVASIGFILFTGLLAGIYPAFFLSAFRPTSALKGTTRQPNAWVNPRQVLVVLQFSFAVALIICTIVVQQQVKFAQSRDTGYNFNALGYVFIQGDIDKNYSLIKNELLGSGVANSVTKTQGPLTENWSVGSDMKWQGKNPNAKIPINRFTEDGNLVRTAGMQLVAGRDIDVQKYPSDSTACLISESAVKVMGFKNPIGQIIFDEPINWHVVGVIKDFILESPYDVVKPFMVKGPKYGGSVIHIKFKNEKGLAESLVKAENIFKKYNPGYPFEFHFTDEEYQKKFNEEQLAGTLASLFAALTIFLSCLGLFGLATYMATNRKKEIGVRKVLGASVIQITTLLSKDFMKLVVIAILIASPVAWWATEKWLESYNYRISVNGWMFALAGSFALAVAFITTSFQAIKAAISNPVKNLRTE